MAAYLLLETSPKSISHGRQGWQAPFAGIPYPFPHPAQPSVSWVDTIGFAAFLVSASICLGELGQSPSLELFLSENTYTLLGAGFSASYHTLMAHSERVAVQWNRLDYVGIVVLISGTFVPLVHYGFYCDPHLRNTYIALIYTFALGECSRHFTFSLVLDVDATSRRLPSFSGGTLG
jgi:adiponectin receptor